MFSAETPNGMPEDFVGLFVMGIQFIFEKLLRLHFGLSTTRAADFSLCPPWILGALQTRMILCLQKSFLHPFPPGSPTPKGRACP